MELLTIVTALIVLGKQTEACERMLGPCKGPPLPRFPFPPPVCPPPPPVRPFPCSIPMRCPPPRCPPPVCTPCLIPMFLPFTPPVADCCKTCGCLYRGKRDTSTANYSLSEVGMESVCNNGRLMLIMEKAIGKDPMESALAIKKAADSTPGEEFNVFCAKNELTHVTQEKSFCQHKKGNVICFAYKS